MLMTGLAVLVILLAGCSPNQDSVEGSGSSKYWIDCIDGVEYLRRMRTMAPHFKPDGTLYTCVDS